MYRYSSRRQSALVHELGVVAGEISAQAYTGTREVVPRASEARDEAEELEPGTFQRGSGWILECSWACQEEQPA